MINKKSFGCLVLSVLPVVCLEVLFHLGVTFKLYYVSSIIFILLVVTPIILNLFFYLKFAKRLSRETRITLAIMSLIISYVYIYLRLSVLINIIFSSLHLKML
jgi:hypothetical protein